MPTGVRVYNDGFTWAFRFSEKPLFFCKDFSNQLIRTHLKNRILVRDRGGAEIKTGGILLYVEDLKRGTNKEIGPKDIFEMGSSVSPKGNELSLPALDLLKIRTIIYL